MKKYVALLRGINVGKSKRVPMEKLREIFTSLEHINISTYINSGNVIFESTKNKNVIHREIGIAFKKELGFEIPTLVKTAREMGEILKSIPPHWENDLKQRTDVAYLFSEIDSENILEKLPIDKKFVDIRYTKGAIFWNVQRQNYNKSKLNRLIDHELYQLMTIRNVNTARFLATPYFSK
jgi:uncharacterized protein (DUF1697 family)